ncbi:thiamine pyrophosphokinase [Phlebopus sp. FC_14]|nr:thiamine pyrophosphokinase [Phlebopus sp. FC_14]
MAVDISKLSPAPLKVTDWEVTFLNPLSTTATVPRALIILNQPFSRNLLDTLWSACSWRCCADGGGNRLFDLLEQTEGDVDSQRTKYLPDLIKGDMDSLRADVRKYYSSKGVPVLHDPDQYSTDLMKCVQALEEKEKSEGQQYELLILGGLSGRLDQTAHTLSYLHKLRRTRSKVYAITDDNIAWVLDQGEHHIHIDHAVLGVTCGILPFGVNSTVLSTSGLRWNLDAVESSFDGLISTSNHLVLEERIVTIKTTQPIWWCAELRKKD